MIKRCEWCGEDPLYLTYHDTEWGVPVFDDRKLYEMLILEGAQAGLSWLTILRKREGYRKAFDAFDPLRIAHYQDRDIQRLMQDSGIVRNRLKIHAAIRNARGFVEITEAHGSFSGYLWGFVDGQPITNHWRNLSEVPAQTRESAQMSKALKQRGFNFVGPTICYAFMQATGMVNDHTINCFRHSEILTADPA